MFTRSCGKRIPIRGRSSRTRRRRRTTGSSRRLGTVSESNLIPPVFHENELCILRIPDTPSSLNKVGQRGSWKATHFHKKRWQEILERYLMMARLPRPLPHFLKVEAELVFPRRHRRDAGNYQAPLEKALGDALVNGGWLPDDTPRWWSFEELRFAEFPGLNTTIIIMDYGRETG